MNVMNCDKVYIPDVTVSESTESSFGTVLLSEGDVVSTRGTESSGRSMPGDEVDRGGGSPVTPADLDDVDGDDVRWESASREPS